MRVRQGVTGCAWGDKLRRSAFEVVRVFNLGLLSLRCRASRFSLADPFVAADSRSWFHL